MGRRGERIAAEYLELTGCTIIDRNFRAGPLEIDLVARDGSCIVFVEVKLRRSASFGGALDAVRPGKLRRIRAAARQYIASTPSARPAREYRFDLVALDVDPRGEGMVLRHLRGII
jgi:putative endonuclease